MRILHIGKHYIDVVGGIQRHIQDLTQLQQNRHQIKILVANTHMKTVYSYEKKVVIVKVATFSSIFSAPISLCFPIWLNRLSTQCDLLHMHLMNPLAVISYLLIRPVKPLVVTYHNDIQKDGLTGFFLRLITGMVLNKAIKIIVTSPQMIKTSQLLHKYSNKTTVVPLGITESNFYYTRDLAKISGRIRQRYPGFLLLFIGRIVPYKGLQYLLQAMPSIEAKLLIIGTGPIQEELMSLSRRLDIKRKVRFIGAVTDEELPAYYHACDLFVLPSIDEHEGFGLVQLEAHFCGKPVISTQLPTGVPWVNQHRRTGLVVPPGDSEKLAGAINELLDDKDLRLKMGTYAQQRAQKQFTREIMDRRTERIYMDFLNRR